MILCDHRGIWTKIVLRDSTVYVALGCAITYPRSGYMWRGWYVFKCFRDRCINCIKRVLFGAIFRMYNDYLVAMFTHFLSGSYVPYRPLSPACCSTIMAQWAWLPNVNIACFPSLWRAIPGTTWPPEAAVMASQDRGRTLKSRKCSVHNTLPRHNDDVYLSSFRNISWSLEATRLVL